MHLLSSFALLGLGYAWLVPDHYLPWPAFLNEAMAAAALALFMLPYLLRKRQWRWPLMASVAGAAVLLVAAQVAAGLIVFSGDAWMAGLYLAAFALAISAGATLPAATERASPWEALWWTIVIAAIASAAAALTQWLMLPGLEGVVTAIPSYSRPSGNLAQPNQLATLLSLGLVGTLALRQAGRMSRGTAVLVGLWLVFGIVLTRSRLGWVVAASLSFWYLSLGRRNQVVHRASTLLPLLVVFLVLQVTISPIADALYLAPARTLAEQAHTGTRSDHWVSMVDAAMRAPWFGHGWGQVALAQSLVATDHVATWEQLDHSHNLLLDLLIWNGLPLGLLLIGALGWWFVSRWRRLQDPHGTHLMAAVMIVFMHALVEFPLEYAYFLLPVGLMIGGIERCLPHGMARPVVPRWPIALLWLGCTALGVLVSRDYLEAEQNFRTFRLEAARIGTGTVTSVAPDLRWLTQQRALLEFARAEAKPGLTAGQLDAMRAVTQRFGSPPVLFRYALASALNGRPGDARHTLELLCVTQVPMHCDEGRATWDEMRKTRYPQLSAIAYPATPRLGERLAKPAAAP